jgi:hypothetical protein
MPLRPSLNSAERRPNSDKQHRMIDDIPHNYEREIHGSFDSFLAEHGFSRTKSSAGDNAFSTVYRNGERYILIGGTLRPQDYPFYLYLSLGEGSDEIPLSEWNAVAFWRIMQKVSPLDYERYLPVFSIPAGVKREQIADQIETVRELCLICGREFLDGDLELFRRARSEQNRDREPHKIYALCPDGQYRLTFEEEGRRLKELYS